MRFLGLLIILVFSSVIHASDKASKPCLNAIHDHYLFKLLIEPTIKTMPKSKQEQAIQKGNLPLVRIERECDNDLATGILSKTKAFHISKSRYLKYFEQDLGIDLPLVGQTIPLDRANMNDQELKLWASLVLLKSYEISADNFNGFSHLKSYYNTQSLQKVADDIYVTYLKGRSVISESNVITITDKSLEVHGNIVALPNITYQGVDKQGHYMWRLKVPILVQTIMADRVRKEKIVVLMQVTRVEPALSVDGLLVSKFNLEFE
tara:strand:+ start:38956 stop:39744 length:789 start_codon:yes stop_codon:yes gene_type:complete